MKPRTKVADLKIGEFYEVRRTKCKLVEMRVERKDHSRYYAKTYKDGYRIVRESDGLDGVVTYHKIGLQWDVFMDIEAKRAAATKEYDERNERDRRTILMLVNCLGSLGVSLVDANRYSEDNIRFAPTRLEIRANEAQGIIDMLRSKGVLL